MSWFGQTDEAQIHRQNCNGCEKCVWIEESSNAMEQYGTEIKPEPAEEPPTIMPDIDRSGREFESFEDKVGYVKKLFK